MTRYEYGAGQGGPMTAPQPADPLRAALDAHEFIGRTWLNGDEFGDMCRCDQWERPHGNDARQEWADHREAAVRAALADHAALGLPDESGIRNWPGGGARVSKDALGGPIWMSDPDGAWVVLYAPRLFYDGLLALTEPK